MSPSPLMTGWRAGKAATKASAPASMPSTPTIASGLPSPHAATPVPGQ